VEHKLEKQRKEIDFPLDFVKNSPPTRKSPLRFFDVASKFRDKKFLKNGADLKK